MKSKSTVKNRPKMVKSAGKASGKGAFGAFGIKKGSSPVKTSKGKKK